MKIVEVIWEDAWSMEAWEPNYESLTGNEIICSTVGYLIKRDKKGITLSATANSHDHRAGVWRIPAGMVRKVIVLGTTTFKVKG